MRGVGRLLAREEQRGQREAEHRGRVEVGVERELPRLVGKEGPEQTLPHLGEEPPRSDEMRRDQMRIGEIRRNRARFRAWRRREGGRTCGVGGRE